MKLQGEKYLWNLPAIDQSHAYAFASTYNISLALTQTLLNRGLSSDQDLEQFLFSSYEKDVAHPSLLKDAEKTVDRILYAIKHQEKILIAGDYDVDGITSSALLLTCLLPLDAQINFFLPHRINDGYGLSVKTVQRAAQNGYKVIVTVDNGITCFDAAQEAQRLGIDLIITDHHRPHDHLPEAFAVVDPHQSDCQYPYKKFAGVGVGFKLMQLLYERLGRELPPKVYELLLLGTVADVVPLTGENRFWVRYGLQQVNAFESVSLKVLKENARFTKPAISSTDIGFFLTPQINALGRLDDPRLGVKFLIGSDYFETAQIGKMLGELNQARKTLELAIFNDVEAAILEKRIDLQQNMVLIAAQEGWPTGVIGLVASRLVQAYGRPTILLHKTKDGLAKGSCRSIREINMFDALCSVKDILKTFGGHPMAAGLSLDAAKIPELQERLNAYCASQVAMSDLVQKVDLEAELTLPEVNAKLMADMAYLEPFGCENAQPKFYIKNVMMLEAPTLLKDLHVKCSVFSEGIIKPVIFFNRPELYPKFVAQKNEPFSLAATVTENHWNGRTNIEFQGVDVAGLTNF